jgi:hypothetical protein
MEETRSEFGSTLAGLLGRDAVRGAETVAVPIGFGGHEHHA